MANTPQLVDQWGRPIKRDALSEEVSAPTFGSVRSPVSGYPADGLNPLRLAAILREADTGDPIRYLELAETIEERDPHYLGVLGTRKRSISQIEITVEAASDAPADVAIADEIRDWLNRDELADELFDILDAIGKGFSFTEIIWDASEGQFQPQRLEWRDPRWFRFARHDLATPLMLGEYGEELPLPGFKFIYNRMRAKSGLVLRSGLARVASWGWMFKAFTQRDWAIFTQTYGQPLRVGKFGPGASEKDRDTLFRAVANIAGDCAAIIPESMVIDFVESKNVGASSDHYERRSDWLDKQISKAVLGQTATTDAETGGLGSGKEHREVQEDIERADCKALSATLNRDLVRPYVDLNHGPQVKYPRLVIARPETEDLKAMSDALGPMIDRGLKVTARSIRDKFGLPEASNTDEILHPSGQNPVEAPNEPGKSDGSGPEASVKYPLKGQLDNSRPDTALQAEDASTGVSAPLADLGALTDRMTDEASPAMEAMLERIEAMMLAANSLDEFREMLLAGFPELDAADLAEVMAQSLAAAHIGGRAMLEAESG